MTPSSSYKTLQYTQNNNSRHYTLAKKSTLLGFALLSLSSITYAHDDTQSPIKPMVIKTIMEKAIKSVPVTGANSFCGKSVFKFPYPFPTDLQFAFLGEYNSAPNAIDALPLNDSNCNEQTVLATTTDAGFISLIGGPDADFRLKNRKLRDVPTYLGPDGTRRVIPRSQSSDSMFPPVKVNGENDVTLGEWIKAKGRMKITCFDDQTSTIHIAFKQLLPQSLYSVWGFYATTLPGQSQRQLIPVPLGGVPNAVSSDRQGRGKFERTVNGCPLQTLSDGSELMMVILNYHADGSVYGGDPDTGLAEGAFVLENGVEFISTHPAGILNHDQLVFPVRLLEYQ